MLLGKKKKRDLSRPPKRPERPAIPIGAAVRMFLVGSLAVVATVWAVWHQYTKPRTPLVTPASPPSSVAPSATEIPVEMESTP